MDWTRQGGAVTSSVRLIDGRTGKLVLVADRANPKGAMLILTDAPTEQNTFPLDKVLDAFHPHEVAETLCMQERLFGSAPLNAVDI